MFTDLQNLLKSPPAQLLTGGTLAGVIWKLSEKLDSLLSKDTKLAAACWLLDRQFEVPLRDWPATVTEVLERAFGRKHLSWSCFWRSSVASGTLSVFWVLIRLSLGAKYSWPPFTPRDTATRVAAALGVIVVGFFVNAIPEFFSLWETRWALRLMQRTHSEIARIGLLVIDLVVTYFTTFVGGLLFLILEVALMAVSIRVAHKLVPDGLSAGTAIFVGATTLNFKNVFAAGFCFPSLFTSLWLWMYYLAVLVLRFARRVDKVYQWLIVKAEIEEKPFQQIGFVTGLGVACIYWSIAIFLRYKS